MPFHYDSSEIKENDFVLVPEGWHAFKIIEAEETKSSKGNDMILAKCRVMSEPEFVDVDVVVFHYVTFLPPENKGAFINVAFRKAIGVPHGGDDVIDAEEWVGKSFMGSVVHEEYKGVMRPKIEKVSPMKEASRDMAAALNVQKPTKAKLMKTVKEEAADDADIPF